MNARDRDLAQREAERLAREALSLPARAKLTAVWVTDEEGHLRPLDIVLELRLGAQAEIRASGVLKEE